MIIFSIRDIKTSAWEKPFLTLHQEQAIRSLKAELEVPKSLLQTYASDFELWRVGHFAQDSGNITQDHALICNVSALVDIEPKNQTQMFEKNSRNGGKK